MESVTAWKCYLNLQAPVLKLFVTAKKTKAMQLTLSQAIQRRKKTAALVTVYSNCSELPIGIFFRIVETGNLSLLSKDGKKVKELILDQAWHSIQLEFEQLTNSNEYSIQLRHASSNTQRYNRLNGLISLYYMANLSSEPIAISDELKFWGVSGNDVNSIKVAIKQEQTKLSIDSIKKNVPKGDKRSLEELIVSVENGLNKDFIDPEKTSVKKWIFLCKSLESKAQALKKSSNGKWKD